MDFRGIGSGSGAANPATGHTEHFIRENTQLRRGNTYSQRKGEHGSAILESFLSMILLGLILFGVLQLFQLIVTSMVTDYAAFRGARSAAVGFKDEYAYREAEIKVAPVSGHIVRPNDGNNTLNHKKALLKSYLAGQVDVEYNTWIGKNRIHTNYSCPEYGQPLSGDCSICQLYSSSHTNISVWELGKTMKFKFEFVDYPLDIPLHDLFTDSETIDISGEAELTNHSAAYLE